MTIYWMKMVALMGSLIYIYFSPENSLPQLNVLWEKIGPGIAFETLTLATLGWRCLLQLQPMCVQKGRDCNTEAFFPQAEGKTNQDAWQSFQRAPIRHVMVLVFWSLKKYICSWGITSQPPGKGKHALFGRLRGLRRHVLKQAAIT